jgi:hypothetical protein
MEKQPVEARIHAKAPGCRPPGWIDEPPPPEPVRLPAGGATHACASRPLFAARPRRRCQAGVVPRPFGLAQRAIGGPATDEILVLPLPEVTVPRAGTRRRRTRASLLAAAGRSRRPAAVARGSPASRITGSRSRAAPG